MLEVKFAEVHTPIFHAGKNFGVKLDPAKFAGLSLEYDRKAEELLIHWGDKTGMIPKAACVYMEFGTPTVRAQQQTHPIVAGIAHTAQVETPFGHVHEGPGMGKTK